MRIKRKKRQFDQARAIQPQIDHKKSQSFSPSFGPEDMRTQSSSSSLDARAQLKQLGKGFNLANIPIFPPSNAFPAIQRKMTVGEPGDKYEQEADQVAAKVVDSINQPNPTANSGSSEIQTQEEESLQRQTENTRKQFNLNPQQYNSLQASISPWRIQRRQDQHRGNPFSQPNYLTSTGLVQRRSDFDFHQLAVRPTFIQRQETNEDELMMKKTDSIQRNEMGEEDELAMKRDSIQRNQMEEEDKVQANDLQGGIVTPKFESQLQQAKSGGQLLKPELQTKIGEAMGADFSGVKVHTDSNADRLNQSLQAKAFTTGQDVFFKKGEYQPGSRGGQELIAHELTHVMQQNGKAVQRSQNDKIQVSHKSPETVQRKFGFEIEVPIFMTYTDSGANNPLARGDAMDGTGGGTAFSPTSNFEIKVDHNEELEPLVSHEQKKVPGPNRFPHGPSIIEMVTKPWDELTLSPKDVKNRAKEMVNWINVAKKKVSKGQISIGKGFYLGSDSKEAKALQTTNGYMQATYGVKLSKVPELFEKTGSVNPDVTDHEALTKAVEVGKTVMWALSEADQGWLDNISSADSKSLRGYITLMANYLIAGGRQGTKLGLGKNLIGQYFYKTDMGKLSNALPQPVIERLNDRSNGAIDTIYTELLDATKRDATEGILGGEGVACGKWIWDVLWGYKDTLLNDFKNPYSAELGPEPLGAEDEQESAVILENREIQYLDPQYKKKSKQQKKEIDKFYGSKKPKHKDDLMRALANMTDPKKYPTKEWEKVMLTVYTLVKELNS